MLSKVKVLLGVIIDESGWQLSLFAALAFGYGLAIVIAIILLLRKSASRDEVLERGRPQA